MAIAVVLASTSNAQARPAVVAQATTTKVVLAPLGTLGSEAKVAKNRSIQRTIATGIRAVPGMNLVADKTVRRAIKRAKKPELRVCDGEAKCLAELGKLLNARYVVYGEIGGLGKVRVVYLKIVDVARARELRSTTLELGGAQSAKTAARASAYRLLAPKSYKGRLAVTVDVAGASIYVDGNHVAKSPAKAIHLSVGTHALRVTHPEYRDFVRFVDIAFDTSAPVDVKLTRFPIIRSNINEEPGKGGTLVGGRRVVYRGVERTPWYKRWYTVAGAGAVIFVGSALVVGILADGISHDREKVVGE
jgi:hypothetical protein